jgi:hypothetical protein
MRFMAVSQGHSVPVGQKQATFCKSPAAKKQILGFSSNPTRSGGLPSTLRGALRDLQKLAIARSAFRSAQAHEMTMG